MTSRRLFLVGMFVLIVGIAGYVSYVDRYHVVQVEETAPASWRLADPVTRDSTSAHLLVSQSCSGGASLEGHILDPVVDYQDRAIWITVPIILLPAVNLTDCFKSDPEYPVTVELSQPVGDRQLLNGSNHAAVLDLPSSLPPEPAHKPLPGRLLR